MPNWCTNELTIEAAPETLEIIRSFVGSEEQAFDFENIIPMPAHIYRDTVGREELERYANINWYDWCWAHWNTKWNAEEVEVYASEVRNTLSYSFETAWSPCDPVIKEFASLFPMAKIDYRFFEEGVGFCGQRIFENGTIVYHVDADYIEHWFCDDDDDDDERDPSPEPGIHYSVENKENEDELESYDFDYIDANDERYFHINGHCTDKRAIKADFYW